MSERPDLGNLNDIVPDDVWDEVMEGDAPESVEAAKPDEPEDEPEEAEEEFEQVAEDDSTPEEPAEQETQADDNAPEGTKPWVLKNVLDERKKRQEAQKQNEALQKRLEMLEALVGNRIPQQQMQQQAPEDDFDTYLKSLLGEQKEDEYGDTPSLPPQVARELHELRKQTKQFQNWQRQQSLKEQQAFIRNHVADIRKDHPMVPEKVLINAIAQGIDPVEMALEVRAAYESSMPQAPTPARKEPPKPLSTPPKSKGGKAAPKKKPTRRQVPAWAKGRGKVPDLSDDIERELEDIFR